MGGEDRHDHDEQQAHRVALDDEEPEIASPLSQRSMPKVGDVLASERSARADVYTISIVPVEAHMAARRYSDAVEKVSELAQQLRVDAWYTPDQTHYASVVSYRLHNETTTSAAHD